MNCILLRIYLIYSNTSIISQIANHTSGSISQLEAMSQTFLQQPGFDCVAV